MKPKTLAILTAAAIGTATTFIGLEHLTCDHTEKVCLITSLMNYIDQDSPIPYGIMKHQAPEISKELKEQGVENPNFYISDIAHIIGKPSSEEPLITTHGNHIREIYPENFYFEYDKGGRNLYHGIIKGDKETICNELPYTINEKEGFVSYFYLEEGFFITLDPNGQILSHGLLETATGLVIEADQEFDGAAEIIRENEQPVYQKTLVIPTKNKRIIHNSSEQVL